MLPASLSAGRRRSAEVLAAEERPRERQNDERERRETHHQEEPVADAPALNGLVGDAPQEHQRRKVDDVLALLLNQVQQHRNREARKRGEEERRQKSHVSIVRPGGFAPPDPPSRRWRASPVISVSVPGSISPWSSSS